MTIRCALLALALSASVAQAQHAPARDAQFRDRVSSLIAVATSPARTPERQHARDVLFREIKPQLLHVGAAPSALDAQELTRAMASVPCVAGRPRLVRAVVHGDLAYVSVAGQQGGGCTYLMHRVGGGWAELMPLGWTLNA